jgi:hypothetical protein
MVRLGFEVRVEAVASDTGEPVSVQLTRAQAETFDLARGVDVHLRPIGPTVATAAPG